MICLDIFGMNLDIINWLEEEGVDDEEIKKKLIDQVSQKYREKKNKIFR